MAKTRCPNCGHTVQVERPHEGEIIRCSKCGAELEIIRKDPLTFDPVGDWQEDDTTW